jgi:hypothetical protein
MARSSLSGTNHNFVSRYNQQGRYCARSVAFWRQKTSLSQIDVGCVAHRSSFTLAAEQETMLRWSNSGTCGARSLSQSGAPAPLSQLPPTNLRTSPRVNTSRTGSFTSSHYDVLRNIRQSRVSASQARNGSVAVRAAYTGIGMLGGFHDSPESVDPLHQAPGSTYAPGSTFSVHGPAELDEFVTQCSDQVVILMCKARACRPCKAFTRKYMHLAERFTSSVFLDVTGEHLESPHAASCDMQGLIITTNRLVQPCHKV